MSPLAARGLAYFHARQASLTGFGWFWRPPKGLH